MLAAALTASPKQPKQQLKRSKAHPTKSLRLKPDADYSSAITALVIITGVISAAVVYVLAQPTGLPRYKEDKEGDC